MIRPDWTSHVCIDKEQKRVLTEQITAHGTERNMEKHSQNAYPSTREPHATQWHHLLKELH